MNKGEKPVVLRRRTVVEDSPVEDVAVTDQAVIRDQVIDLSRIATLLAGAAFVVLGAVVLLDTGLAGFPDLPRSVTFGFVQTPLLGAVDLLVGLLLLAGASGWDRSVTTFVSSVMVVAGFIVLFSVDRLPAALATNTRYGVFLAVVGVALLLIAMAVPAVRSRSRVRRTLVR